MPAASTLKENLPIDSLLGDASTLAGESGSFLCETGLWERLMNDALCFRNKTEKNATQLQSGIHANGPRIWEILPIVKKIE